MIDDQDAGGYGQGQMCGVYRKEVEIHKMLTTQLIIVVRVIRVKINLIST